MTTLPYHPNITVALTGASIMPLAITLIERLVASGARLSVVYSDAAKAVIREESDLVLSDDPGITQQTFCDYFNAAKDQITVYAKHDWHAPMASGSGKTDAMVICPASMGTVSAIAHGVSDDLLTRAADVMIKEKKPLVIVPREAPLSVIHLENLLTLVQAGATIVPAVMTFYHQPDSIDDMIGIIVSRIMNHLGIHSDEQYHWGNPDR